MGRGNETSIAFARNLQRLMEHRGLSQAQLAKEAHLGQSTLSKLLDFGNPSAINPRATTIEKLAAYFGVPSWQLMIPDIPVDLLVSTRMTKLVENYKDSTEEGRKHVERGLEIEAEVSRGRVAENG